MVAQYTRRHPHQPNTVQKPRQQRIEQQKHPHDTIRALLSLLAEYGLSMWLDSETDMLCMERPTGWSERDVRALVKQIEQHRDALRCYYGKWPKEEWPRCFFGDDGTVLHCIRGHEYDLCTNEQGQPVCRCYYDFSWSDRKRIGKERYMYKHTLFFESLSEADAAREWIDLSPYPMVFGYTEEHRGDGPLYEFFTDVFLSEQDQYTLLQEIHPKRSIFNIPE